MSMSEQNTPRPRTAAKKQDNYSLGMVVLIIGAIVLGLVLPFIPPFSGWFSPTMASPTTSPSPSISPTLEPSSTVDPLASPVITPSTTDSGAAITPGTTAPGVAITPGTTDQPTAPAITPSANTPAPTASTSQPTLPADAWATGDVVNMRQAPNSNANTAIVARIPQGTKLQVQQVAADDAKWYQVVYNGQTGYVHSDFISFTQPNANSAWNKDTSSLRLRKEANATSDVLANVPSGAEVTVVDWPENATWARVTFSGQTGYLMTQYLTRVKP